MRLKPYLCLLTLALVSGCATQEPLQWNPASDSAEAEYQPYLAGGTASLSGQAFLVQRGGNTVKAAGRTVTLDPATVIGAEWWGKAGISWKLRGTTPPSPGFVKARKSVVADADGRFKFTDLAAGQYYVRTEVTWETGTGLYGSSEVQGGLVGKRTEIKAGQAAEVILNEYPH